MNTTSNSFDNIVRSLKTLQNHAAAWQRDCKAKRDGWKIYYAVDADVVSMYLSPELVASYGKVFHETDEIGGYLANLLADALFHADQREEDGEELFPASYLIIPPHDEELRSIMQAIARGTERALKRGKEFHGRLSGIFSDLSRGTVDRAQITAELQKSAKELIELSNEIDGYLSAQDRFASLPAGKLLNIWNERARDNRYLINVTEAELRSAIHIDQVAWYDRLNEKRRTRYGERGERADTVDNDAQVLATIDYVNDELCGRKIKVMLVTGSPYVFAAAREYVSTREYNRDNCLNFADLCLRHPQWIMSSPRFFEPIRADASLERWLRILSPEHGEIGEQSIAESVEQRELEKIPSEWQRIVRLLVTTKYGSRGIAESMGKISENPLIRQLTELAESGKLTPQNFLEMFEEPVTASLSRLYLSSTWIGLLDSAARSDKPPKAMPALQFDFGYEQFNGYYTDLLKLFEDVGDPDKRRGNIIQVKLLNERINKPDGDDSLYHSHIIHGAAYAARGLWEPALALCRIAIRIADGLLKRDEGDLRRGREAAYLAAVVCRRSAARVESLNDADEYLRVARSRETPGAPPDVRFKSEELAVRIRRLYFRYFVDKTIEDHDEFIVDIEVLCAELLNVVREAKGELGTARDPTASGRSIVRWVLRQCYTNLFDLLLILLDEGDESLFLPDKIKVFKEYGDSITSRDEQRDPHAWIVCQIVSLLLFSVTKQRAPYSRAELRRRIDLIPKVAPYDGERVRMFRRLLESPTLHYPVGRIS